MNTFFGRIFAIFSKLALGVVLLALLAPPAFAAWRWEQPMLIPEAQGISLHSFYRDRRAAYSDAWAQYGVELGRYDNPLLDAINQAQYTVGMKLLGNPVCGNSSLLVIATSLAWQPAAAVLNQPQVGLTGLSNRWWAAVEQAIWDELTRTPSHLAPQVCRAIRRGVGEN